MNLCSRSFSYYILNSLQMKYFTIYYMISCAKRKKEIILKVFDFLRKKGMCSDFNFIVYKITELIYVIKNFPRLQKMFCIGNNNNNKKMFHVHQVQTFIKV
jgi:hypothetical protein